MDNGLRNDSTRGVKKTKSLAALLNLLRPMDTPVRLSPNRDGEQ
jgi:hypothetical protein